MRFSFGVPGEPVQEARVEAMRARGEDPFLGLIVPRAVIRFRQGFGRLIRSTTDTGVVAILDPRIKSKFYGKYFINSLPDCKKVSDIKDIKDFFDPAHNHVD